jgi:hypothetical protein
LWAEVNLLELEGIPSLAEAIVKHADLEFSVAEVEASLIDDEKNDLY